MKKNVLFIALSMLIGLSVATAQQDTVIGFTFSDDTDTEFNANLGVDGNLSYDIRVESDSDQTVGTLSYTNGVEDNAATAANWDNGSGDKYWSVKFKADGFTNLTVSSLQRSGGTNAGPKDWKIQTRLSGGDWEDVVDGAITVANDWTTGVATDLPLSSALDNPGTTSVYVRWIMTSNLDADGVELVETGISKIDNIVIKGINTTGVESVVYAENVDAYPNPCHDILSLNATEEIVKVQMFNQQGSVISENVENLFNTKISLDGLSSGIYFVRVYFRNEMTPVTKRIVVE